MLKKKKKKKSILKRPWGETVGHQRQRKDRERQTAKSRTDCSVFNYERNEWRMKSSRKIRENVLFTRGYSRNKVKSRHFRKKRSCSPEAHPQDVTSGRATKPEGLRCRVWRDLCCLRPELEETRPPEKHLCGAPLGTEGNPTESPQSKRGGQRPLQTGQEQTRPEEAPSPQDGTAESCHWGEVCATAVGALRHLWRLWGPGTRGAGPQQSTSSSPVTTGRSSANSLWGRFENCLQRPHPYLLLLMTHPNTLSPAP